MCLPDKSAEMLDLCLQEDCLIEFGKVFTHIEESSEELIILYVNKNMVNCF